jgi:2-keto-4-pentenoate hydratase/2-oxohepta-3-ene-1,7-dioic acid hydratase in catechol pathway
LRFVTFEKEGNVYPAVWTEDNEIVSIRRGGFDSVIQVAAGGADALDRVRRWVDSAPGREVHKPSAVRMLAPIPRPTKVICIGLNYRDHAEESNLPLPKVPTVFAKFATAVIGPNADVVLPKASTQPDYEAEFVFVIGRGGRYIPEERALEHVFGYTIMNDVSARDFQTATPQWTMGKTFDTFAPIGPAVTTRDAIADPHNLAISLTLNGQVMQNSNTSNLVFGVPALIAFLSSVFTLEPGDIVATGTPGGVGFARKPPVWLKPGDEMIVRIEGLGELTNLCVAEA